MTALFKTHKHIALLMCQLLFVLIIFSAGGALGGEIETKLQALDAAYRAGILSEEEFRSKRTEILNAQNRQGALPASTPSEGAVVPAPGRNTGQMYHHPTGISIWYPSGWQASMLEGILQLLPQGAAATADAYESYYITAEDVTAEGITTANHPSVIAYLDEQMQALGMHLGGVYFERSGGVNAINTSQGKGQGIRTDYVAQSSIGPIRGSAYAVIIKNYGLVLAGVGVKDLLARRQKDVLRIFTSMGVGEGKLDRMLVGAWRLTSTRAIQNDSVWETDYSRAKAVSETQSTLRFNPDGSWVRENKTEMIAGAGSVWLESKDTKVYRGRWNADAGHLFMVWEDESFEDYKYRIQGNRMQINTAKTGQIWEKAD